MIDARLLFDRHHLDVFRFLRRATGRQETAEDLLQETFLRVVRARERFDGAGSERAWVFRIARNLVLNRRRDAARRPDHDELKPAAGPAAADPVDDRVDLDRALAHLEPSCREAFLLREVGGLGYREIGSILDRTPDAVRNRIYRARMALRCALVASRADVVRFPKEHSS